MLRDILDQDTVSDMASEDRRRSQSRRSLHGGNPELLLDVHGFLVSVTSMAKEIEVGVKSRPSSKLQKGPC